jgi:two-component system sensor histidine kinase/response regulator
VLDVQKADDTHRERPRLQEVSALVPINAQILLVEDNRVNREVATSMLNAMHCSVVQVTNGQDAVAIVRRQAFDLVLMDCEMPIMDGYAATEAIRKWELEVDGSQLIPIVALTAHALPEDRRRCLDLGMNDFLSKPFSMNALHETIVKWLPTLDESTSAIDIAAEPAPNELPPESAAQFKYRGAISTQALEMISSLDQSQGKDLANRIITVYESSSAELIDALTSALSTNDRKGIGSAAHALKSSSGNVGAERLVSMCKDIETAAHNSDSSDLTGCLMTLQEEHRLVIEELKKWSQG